MFEETIEVRDPINLDELTKKEFSFTVDYSIPLRDMILKSGNMVTRSNIPHSMIEIPSGKEKKKVKIIAKIFSGFRHRDILAEMQERGYFGANIFEGTRFSAEHSNIQHQIAFFAPAKRDCDCYNNVHTICFSVNDYGEKNISCDIIHFKDESKNEERIYLLGVKVEEIEE